MMQLSDRPIGTPVSVLVEGTLASDHVVTVYRDGAVASPAVAVTVQSLGSNKPSKLTFTPLITGVYVLVLQTGAIAAVVEAVARTISSYVKNIEDEALGSWTWDRAEGTLQLLRQDGSSLATFAVVDTLTENSRERLL